MLKMHDYIREMNIKNEAQRKRRTKLSRKDLTAKPPNEIPAIVYTGEGKAVSIQTRKRGEGVQPRVCGFLYSAAIRLRSRTRWINGSVEKLANMKNAVGGEAMFVIYDPDRDAAEVYTTNPGVLNYSKENTTSQSTDTPTQPKATHLDVTSALAHSTISPSRVAPFITPAIASNTIPHSTTNTTEQIAADDVYCQCCSIFYGSSQDEDTDSPWIGCGGTVNGEECSYWVHSVCLGFADASEWEAKCLPKFYCPSCNTRSFVDNQTAHQRPTAHLSKRVRRSRRANKIVQIR